jgi:hypothetical protein
MEIKINGHNNQALNQAIIDVTKPKHISVTTTLPPELYKKFKAVTLERDTTVKNALIELITLYIDNNK